MNDIAERLRKLIAIAEQDPSWVGGTITIFESLLREAADQIDNTAIVFEQNKAYFSRIKSLEDEVEQLWTALVRERNPEDAT